MQVIVTTERRGVFYGRLVRSDEDKRIAVLMDAYMAIYWGTTGGLFQLADSGPTEKSKISSKAYSITLHLVECIIEVTKEGIEAWEKKTQ